MGRYYFIWNGVDCGAMGITLQSPIPLIRPEERITHVTIPGRSGDLTQLEGEDVFNSYIQTALIQVRGAYRMREVYSWLKGSGLVTFHNDPEKQQRARVIGAVTLAKFSPNLDVWTGECQFYCEPYKSEIFETPVTVSSSGSSVFNNGDVQALPKLTVTCSANANTSITIGGKTFGVNLTGTGLTGYILDSEAQIVTSLDGNTNLTSKMTGEFPTLALGANAVTWSSVTRIVFDRRVRYL